MSYDPSFQAKVFPILKQLFETYLGSVVDGRIYYSVAPAVPTFPYVVYQSQDGGGRNSDYVDQSGWEGLITFRSIDTDSQTASNNLIALSDRLVGLQVSGIVGYSIKYKPEHPQPFPVEKNSQYGSIYTEAIVVSFSVYKD